MTKRFTLTNPKNSFQDTKCGIDNRGNTFTFNEVVDMLNAFNDENKQLKEENEELNEELMECDSFKKIYKEKIERLENENEQLKLKNKLLERDLYYCAKQFKEDVENILLDLKGDLND